MSDLVLILLPGLGTLKLPRDVYEQHLVRPETVVAAAPAEPGLVDARTLAGELSLPVSCIYEYAKAGRIPSVRVGRHVRFDRRQVRAALDATVSVSVSRPQAIDPAGRATKALPRHRATQVPFPTN